MTALILRAKDVAAKLSVSRATVWAKINEKHKLYDPDFPRPFKIGERATGWLESEISAYAAKLAERRL